MKEVGSDVKTTLKFYPQHLSGEGVIAYGPAFDRLGYESGVFNVGLGDVEGSPTNLSVTMSLSESLTEAGVFAAVTLTDYTVAITGELAAIPGKDLEVNMNLRGRNRWLKIGLTPAFGGGSSPKVVAGVTVVLGEAQITPAV